MIDTSTLYIASTVSRGAFLVIFMATVLSQPKKRYLWHWIAALVGSMLGSALMFLSQKGPATSMLIQGGIYALYLASLVFSWSGIRLFHKRYTPYRYLLALTLAPSLLFITGVFFAVPLRLTLAFLYLFSALMAALTTYETLKPPRERLLSQYVVAFAFCCYAIVLLIPGLCLLFGLLATEALTTGREALMLDQVMSVLVYFGYIAMANERSNLQLKQLSEIDPLTGLANRRGMEKATRQLNRQNRSRQPISVLIGDLDHFKTINDRLGHDAGDIVLKDVGARLTKILRPNDLAMRWGGEEFLLILPDTDVHQAILIAERLRHLIEIESFVIEKTLLTVTISLGVSEIKAKESDFEAAISRADSALYQAKKEGRNRVCCLQSQID